MRKYGNSKRQNTWVIGALLLEGVAVASWTATISPAAEEEKQEQAGGLVGHTEPLYLAFDLKKRRGYL